MAFKEPLSTVVLKGVKHFRDRAALASTEEEKLSLLVCAEKSESLGKKLADLELEHTGMSFFLEVQALPESKVLRDERLKRSSLKAVTAYG